MNLRTTLSFLFLASGALAQAAAFTVNPTADVFVSSSAALNNLGSAAIRDSNYGAAGALAVSASGLPKGEFDSLMMFNFAAAKASFDASLGTGQWAVTSITLQLTVQPPNNFIFNGSGTTPANTAGNIALAWMRNKTWTEGTGTPAAPTTTGITFSTLSSFLGASDQSLGTFAFGGGTSGTTLWTLGLGTSLVGDVTAGNQTSLLMAPADSVVAVVVNSQNFTMSAGHPQLTVTASTVPEPAAGLWLGVAAFALLSLRQRA